jgi:hypothetical protein
LKYVLFGLVLGWVSSFASESFEHKDWQLVCDNTHTCRMVGYTDQTQSGEFVPLSVLFVRPAGKGSQIDAYAKFEEGVSESDASDITDHSLRMVVGNRGFEIDASGKLTQVQTDLLVDALVREKPVHFSYGNHFEWNLSQNGSFATMLKMDDYQKRVGTTGAMFKKGNADENGVLQAVTAPVVYAKKIYEPGSSGTLRQLYIPNKRRELLHSKLMEDYEEGGGSECWESFEAAKETLKVYPLTSKKAIASQLCWSAAYNSADAFWTINREPPFDPKFITAASDIAILNDATLHLFNEYKGRGIGDCWGRDEWVWDGTDFVESLHSSTGMCRGLSGGAWELPTFISNVMVQSNLKPGSDNPVNQENSDKRGMDLSDLSAEFAVELKDGRAMILEKKGDLLSAFLLDQKGFVELLFESPTIYIDGSEEPVDAFIYVERETGKTELHFNTTDAQYTIRQDVVDDNLLNITLGIEKSGQLETTEGVNGSSVGDLQNIGTDSSLLNVQTINLHEKHGINPNDYKDLCEQITHLSARQFMTIRDLHKHIEPLRNLPIGQDREVLDKFVQQITFSLLNKNRRRAIDLFNRNYQIYKILLFDGDVASALNDLESELVIGFTIENSDVPFRIDNLSNVEIFNRQVRISLDDIMSIERRDVVQDKDGIYHVSIVLKMRDGTHVGLDHIIYIEDGQGGIQEYGLVGGFG